MQQGGRAVLARRLDTMCWCRIHPWEGCKRKFKEWASKIQEKRDVLIVRVAVLENTGIVVSGHVLWEKNVSTHVDVLIWGRTYPVTSHRVVDMVAVHGGLRTDAGTEAELVFRDEACPLVVLSTRTKGVAVDESTD